MIIWNQMTTLFRKLEALIEDNLCETWMVAMLKQFKCKLQFKLQIITALETRPEGDLTFELVHYNLLEVYKRQNKLIICVTFFVDNNFTNFTNFITLNSSGK